MDVEIVCKVLEEDIPNTKMEEARLKEVDAILEPLEVLTKTMDTKFKELGVKIFFLSTIYANENNYIEDMIYPAVKRANNIRLLNMSKVEMQQAFEEEYDPRFIVLVLQSPSCKLTDETLDKMLVKYMKLLSSLVSRAISEHVIKDGQYVDDFYILREIKSIYKEPRNTVTTEPRVLNNALLVTLGSWYINNSVMIIKDTNNTFAKGIYKTQYDYYDDKFRAHEIGCTSLKERVRAAVAIVKAKTNPICYY